MSPAIFAISAIITVCIIVGGIYAIQLGSLLWEKSSGKKPFTNSK